MQPDVVVNFNFVVGGDDHELQLVFLYPYRNPNGSRPMHVDFRNTVTGDRGRYENMEWPVSPGQGQSKLPGFVGRLVARKAQGAPIRSPRFP